MIILKRAVPMALLAVAALMSTHDPVVADDAANAVAIASKRITDSNPDTRAQAVADLARANNKDGTQYIMRCVSVENDGPAGYRMADEIATLTSTEALEVIEKSIPTWDKPENLFGAYWTFMGLASQGTEKADAIIRRMMLEETDEKDVYLRSALIEAIAEAGRRDLGDLLTPVLEGYDPKWDEDSPIIVLTAVQAAPKLVSAADVALRDKVVLAMADMLEQTENERVEWFIVSALAEISGEDKYIDPEFWRWWIKMGGKKVEKRDDGATVAGRDVPKFFEAAAVGKRVIFVIDISGSMQHPVNLSPEMKKPPEKKEKKEERKDPVTGKGKHDEEEEEEEEEEPPRPDYSGVKTKLDLAKVELIHTLSLLPDDYWFNIVIYHTPHDMIESSKDEFVQATESNKKKFINKVKKLNWANLTNIHGALTRGFCVNSRKSIDPEDIGKKNTNNPAWDPECLRSGATTMFFLTDGSPTISDDTTNPGEVGKPGGPMVGNGRMCDGNNIYLDIKRLNVFRKMVINTIGIGPHAGQLLGALAQMSGGEYINRSGMGG